MEKTSQQDRTVTYLALLAPVIFVLHVVEEGSKFVPWFNRLVEPDISQPLFLRVNATAFVITVLLALLLAATEEPAVAVIDLACLGFLMFANALLHVTGTVVHHSYSPGVVTAVLLYLPYFAVLFAVVLKRLRVPGERGSRRDGPGSAHGGSRLPHRLPGLPAVLALANQRYRNRLGGGMGDRMSSM